MTVTPRSAQDIFNAVCEHLMRQGKKCSIVTSAGGGMQSDACRYRGPDGLMCAVGCLISDQFYSETLEGRDARQGVVLDALEDSGISPRHGLLLMALQGIHDTRCVELWRASLLDIALVYGLNAPACIKETP